MRAFGWSRTARAGASRRARGRLQGDGRLLALALLTQAARPERDRRRARPAAALGAAALLGCLVPGPQRVLRTLDLGQAEPLPRRRRQPRLPAGEPVLPPSEARRGAQRDGDDRPRRARG